MALRLERRHRHGVAHFERRQRRLVVFELRLGIVGAFDVRAQVAGEGDGAALDAELDLLAQSSLSPPA